MRRLFCRFPNSECARGLSSLRLTRAEICAKITIFDAWTRKDHAGPSGVGRAVRESTSCNANIATTHATSHVDVRVNIHEPWHITLTRLTPNEPACCDATSTTAFRRESAHNDGALTYLTCMLAAWDPPPNVHPFALWSMVQELHQQSGVAPMPNAEISERIQTFQRLQMLNVVAVRVVRASVFPVL